ncbi:GNAT family N-acetyltransferase [Gillisia sp. JM1]|uniref:GNAT family N-acetyltransferase n=1 Tax=Gillisia sp. JM1 TaxID=1283286 RepID=UPI00041BD76B|nr:GNAT family N-acetyltransferase [Gillisia sp. JM1]
MTNSNLQIRPSKIQLDEIHQWLKKEYDTTHQGFYCNWSIIVEAFDKERLITFQSSNKAVGFFVWRAGRVHIEIDIMEIAPNFRHKGFGKTFESYISSYFEASGYKAFKLFCDP